MRNEEFAASYVSSIPPFLLLSFLPSFPWCRAVFFFPLILFSAKMKENEVNVMNHWLTVLTPMRIHL